MFFDDFITTRCLDTVIFEIKKCYSVAKVPFLPRKFSVPPPYYRSVARQMLLVASRHWPISLRLGSTNWDWRCAILRVQFRRSPCSWCFCVAPMYVSWTAKKCGKKKSQKGYASFLAFKTGKPQPAFPAEQLCKTQKSSPTQTSLI